MEAKQVAVNLPKINERYHGSEKPDIKPAFDRFSMAAGVITLPTGTTNNRRYEKRREQYENNNNLHETSVMYKLQKQYLEQQIKSAKEAKIKEDKEKMEELKKANEDHQEYLQKQ